MFVFWSVIRVSYVQNFAREDTKHSLTAKPAGFCVSSGFTEDMDNFYPGSSKRKECKFNPTKKDIYNPTVRINIYSNGEDIYFNRSTLIYRESMFAIPNGI